MNLLSDGCDGCDDGDADAGCDGADAGCYDGENVDDGDDDGGYADTDSLDDVDTGDGGAGGDADDVDTGTHASAGTGTHENEHVGAIRGGDDRGGHDHDDDRGEPLLQWRLFDVLPRQQGRLPMQPT